MSLYPLNTDTLPPRYILIDGTRYVLYSLEEDHFIIESLVEKKYLVDELKQCDSLVDVLQERDAFRDVIENGQSEQIDTYKELLDISRGKEEELNKTLEDRIKKDRRKSRVMTALIVIGAMVTGGLLLFAIIK